MGPVTLARDAARPAIAAQESRIWQAPGGLKGKLARANVLGAGPRDDSLSVSSGQLQGCNITGRVICPWATGRTETLGIRRRRPSAMRVQG